MKGKFGFKLFCLLLVMLAVVAFAVPVSAKAPTVSAPAVVVQQVEDPVSGFDLVAEYMSVRVQGIPLAVAVFALVAVLKKLNVKGHWLTGSSFILGTALGILYLYSISPLVGFSPWFQAVIYGLVLGAIASGSYIGIRSASTPSGTPSG